jgi:hypothetical protein
MNNPNNQFSSPKKPPTQNQCIDEWAKVEKLKRQRDNYKTEEQRLSELEKFELSSYSDLSSDSQTELPIERLNSTPKTNKKNEDPSLLPHPGKLKKGSTSLKKLKMAKILNSKARPQIAMEPFHMKEERDYHFIDKKGNFLYKNYNAHNDAWLLSLDEEVADVNILKNKQKTYQYALNKKISRARSEESSLISVEEPMTSESFKEKKIETLKTTLLNLLENGESANRAINRIHKMLPEKKSFKPYKKNVRKNKTSNFFFLNINLKVRTHQNSKIIQSQIRKKNYR